MKISELIMALQALATQGDCDVYVAAGDAAEYGWKPLDTEMIQRKSSGGKPYVLMGTEAEYLTIATYEL